MPTHPMKVALWDAVNRYVISCKGDPGKHVQGNTSRMKAVTEVESALCAVVDAERRELEDLVLDVLSGADILTDRRWMATAKRLTGSR